MPEECVPEECVPESAAPCERVLAEPWELPEPWEPAPTPNCWPVHLGREAHPKHLNY